MNKTFYASVFIFFQFLVAFSQTSGTATYEIRMAQNPGNFSMSDADKQNLPLQVQLQLQASISAAVQVMQLDFNRDKALFHPGEQADTEERSGSTRIMVSAKMEGNGTETYRDLSSGSETNVAALGSQSFCITGTLAALPWKLSNETKVIAGHTCYMATLPGEPVRRIVNGKEDKLPAKDIIAWYAKDIPVQHGPGRYYGLPGLILQVDEGFRNITCTGIDAKNGLVVNMPASGKAISKAEFEKLHEAYLNEIIGKGGSSQIRIEQY